MVHIQYMYEKLCEILLQIQFIGSVLTRFWYISCMTNLGYVSIHPRFDKSQVQYVTGSISHRFDTSQVQCVPGSRANSVVTSTLLFPRGFGSTIKRQYIRQGFCFEKRQYIRQGFCFVLLLVHCFSPEAMVGTFESKVYNMAVRDVDN